MPFAKWGCQSYLFLRVKMSSKSSYFALFCLVFALFCLLFALFLSCFVKNVVKIWCSKKYGSAPYSCSGDLCSLKKKRWMFHSSLFAFRSHPWSWGILHFLRTKNMIWIGFFSWTLQRSENVISGQFMKKVMFKRNPR